MQGSEGKGVNRKPYLGGFFRREMVWENVQSPQKSSNLRFKIPQVEEFLSYEEIQTSMQCEGLSFLSPQTLPVFLSLPLSTPTQTLKLWV